MANRRETMETVTDFIFLGFRITADGDCSHEIKRCMILGKKAMTNLDSKAETLLCWQRSVAPATNEQIHSGVMEMLFLCRLDFFSLQDAYYGHQGSFHTSWFPDTRQKSIGFPRPPLLFWPHQADQQREFSGPHAYQVNCFLSLFSLHSTSSIKSILKSTSVNGP